MSFRLWAGIWLAITILCWGTGLVTDDFVHLWNGLNRRALESLRPNEYLSNPVLHYTHALAYHAIGNNLFAYDLLKAVYLACSVLFASKFLEGFVSPKRAAAYGFVFVFLPLHDSATFWLTGLYLTLSFCLFLFAYAQGVRARYGWATVFSLLGSYSSYGSPPIAIGLTVLALAQRRNRLAACLAIPNATYLIYYIVTSEFLKSGTQRLTGNRDIASMVKQFIIQIASFVDASVGPSSWAKIMYSIGSLNALGVIAGAIVTMAIIWLSRRKEEDAESKHLLYCAAVILFAAFGMFALTGLYPQLAFNLGNRVMIYGSFFLMAALVSTKLPRTVEVIALAVICFATVGVATHWKAWNQDVQALASKIQSNENIKKFAPGEILFVSDHQYSRLGRFCHIDFFTADYVVGAFFKLQLGEASPVQTKSFNRRLKLEAGKLTDRKYAESTLVKGGIWLYDSELNRLDWLPEENIQGRLNSLPDETRHWTQLPEVEWLRPVLLAWIPRLQFAY